jgi:hypothetical protein
VEVGIRGKRWKLTLRLVCAEKWWRCLIVADTCMRLLLGLAIILALVPRGALSAGVGAGVKIDREMMEQICEGQVAVGADNKVLLQCSVCPSYTDFQGQKQPFTAGGTYGGRFSTKGSEQLLLIMDGCESHAMSWGGAFLFTRKGQAWEKSVYFQGHRPEECLTFRGGDGLDRMACRSEDMHFGTSQNWITETSYRNNVIATRVLIGDINGNLGGGDKSSGYCFAQEISSFSKLSAGRGFRIVVEQKKEPAPPDFKQCEDEPGLRGPAEIITLDFLFDGYHFRLAPGMANRLGRVRDFLAR